MASELPVVAQEPNYTFTEDSFLHRFSDTDKFTVPANQKFVLASSNTMLAWRYHISVLREKRLKIMEKFFKDALLPSGKSLQMKYNADNIKVSLTSKPPETKIEITSPEPIKFTTDHRDLITTVPRLYERILSSKTSVMHLAKEQELIFKGIKRSDFNKIASNPHDHFMNLLVFHKPPEVGLKIVKESDAPYISTKRKNVLGLGSDKYIRFGIGQKIYIKFTFKEEEEEAIT